MTRYGSTARHVLVMAACLLVFGVAPAAAGGADGTPVSEAIAAAVRGLMGGVDEVRVTAVSVFATDAAGVNAVPEAGARTSAPARFLLFQGRTRVGYAVATVQVDGPGVHALRELPRDRAISGGDVEETRGALRGLLLQPVPQLAEVLGAQPIRTVAAGEMLTSTVVRIPPVVRLGETVRATIRAGAVEVTALVLAAGSGRIGDIIRVRGGVNRRFLDARITARGAVEVLP